MSINFLFTNDDIKLALICCLENMKNNKKISIIDLWKNLKKIIKNPSFTKFIYLIDKLKTQNLYELEDLIQIKKSKTFYNKMINLLLKNQEKISYKFPVTNELFDDIINKYNINLNQLLKLLDSNKIKISLKKIKNKRKKITIKTFYLKKKIYELNTNNNLLLKDLSFYKRKYYLLCVIFSFFFICSFLPFLYFIVSIY